MFEKTIQNPYLGTLTSQGQCKTWEVECQINGFDDEFSFQVWDDKNGLMPHQEIAVRQLFENIKNIKENATLPMINFWQGIEFLEDYFPNTILENREAIWQYLHPAYSEIRDNGEIALGFVYYTGDYLVFLKVMDGQFKEIGTE